jgi:hypothetical protein
MELAVFILSIVIATLSYIPYIAGILRGKIKPHPITWLSWAIITLVLALVYLTNGGGYATYTTLYMAAICVIVFTLSIKSHVKIAIKKVDIACFVISMIALIIWWLGVWAALSVILLTAAQVFGFIPSIRKAYHRPNDESSYTWAVNSFRYVLMAVIVEVFTLTTLLNSLFWALAYGGAAVFLLIRRKQLNGKEKEISGEQK